MYLTQTNKVVGRKFDIEQTCHCLGDDHFVNALTDTGKNSDLAIWKKRPSNFKILFMATTNYEMQKCYQVCLQ